jgi:hypothetical protein
MGGECSNVYCEGMVKDFASSCNGHWALQWHDTTYSGRDQSVTVTVGDWVDRGLGQRKRGAFAARFKLLRFKLGLSLEVMESNDLWQPLSPQALRPIVGHWARGTYYFPSSLFRSPNRSSSSGMSLACQMAKSLSMLQAGPGSGKAVGRRQGGG